jgi:hypothetical protein
MVGMAAQHCATAVSYLKMIKRAKFILYILCHNKKE